MLPGATDRYVPTGLQAVLTGVFDCLSGGKQLPCEGSLKRLRRAVRHEIRKALKGILPEVYPDVSRAVVNCDNFIAIENVSAPLDMLGD